MDSILVEVLLEWFLIFIERIEDTKGKIFIVIYFILSIFFRNLIWDLIILFQAIFFCYIIVSQLLLFINNEVK